MAKNNIVRKILDKILLAPTEKVEGDVKSYIQAIESGRFRDKVVFGISDEERGFHVLDPVKQPGALYCGGMGSGKSIAMRFTVGTHIASNSENTFYILVDTLKGMTDYTMLFQDETDDFGNIIKKNKYKKNVVAAVNDSSKIVPVIDMIHAECMARKEEFSRVGANNIYSYDKIMKEKATEAGEEHPGLARVMVCIEEFHAIPNSPQVKFPTRVDQQGSIANKLKELMRVGRSYGIGFMFATQRAISEDVPSQLKPGLSMMMAFRMNNPGEASAMNLPHAQEIGVKQRGRCAYEDGFIQYPYIDDKVLQVLLDRYYKPLKAKLLKYQPEDYHKALGGEGNDGMVWIKPFADIVKFASQYDLKTIAKRILKEFKIETELQLNQAYVADMIGTKYDDKYAIRLINDRSQGSKKEIEALQKGAEILGCNKVLIIVSDISNPPGVSNFERDKSDDKIVLDNDDLIQLANMLDSRSELEEKGKFHELYLRYNIADVRDLNSDLNDEELEQIEEEKRQLLQEQNKTEIDYNYCITRGLINDDDFMKSIIIKQYQYAIYNLDEKEKARLMAKLKITEDDIIKDDPEAKADLEVSPSPVKETEEIVTKDENKPVKALDVKIVEVEEKSSVKIDKPIESKETSSANSQENKVSLKEKLRLEREQYKAKLKEERKKFLDKVEEPIEDKTEVVPDINIKIKDKPEKEEVVAEEGDERLDKEVLLKIRDRLKENIRKEREKES